MAEIHEGVITDQDVGQGREPDQDRMPEDPSRSSEASIVAKLTEPSGTAAGMSYGAEEPSSKEHALEALGSLTSALTVESAKSDQLTGEVALADLTAAIEHGVPAEEALGVALASGLIPKETLDELAWQASLAERGFDSDEQLAEFDDPAMDEQIEQRYEQVLGQASALAHQQDVQKVYSETYAQEFALGMERHAESVAALKALQHELKLSGREMEAHLEVVNAELENGLLGPPVDLDQLAISDPRLFAASVRAASATILETYDEAEAAEIKSRIMAQQHDLADGLVIDGQRMKEPTQVGMFANEERFIDRVSKRSKPGPFDGPVSLPPERNVRDGFTVNGRKTKLDDVPSIDGSTARSRHREAEKRGGRAS